MWGMYQYIIVMFFRRTDNLLSILVGDRPMLSIPILPLNTDGVDPAGSNVTIRNLNITCFDDAVAVKPSNKGDVIAKDGCS